MSGHGGGDPLKVIKAALYANFVIALCKFVAAYLSESTATLAEAVHSLADTGNQALLFTGIRLAAQPEMKKIFIEPDSRGDLRGVVRAEGPAG